MALEEIPILTSGKNKRMVVFLQVPFKIIKKLIFFTTKFMI